MIPAPLPPPVPSWVGPPPPAVVPGRRLGRVVAVVGVAVALVVGGAAGYAIGRHNSPPPPVAAAPPVLTPQEATARVCDALKEGYPAVAAAVDEDNQYKSASWSDPQLLAAVNRFISAATQLADSLDAALSPSTPPELRTATTNFVAGLRALSRSKGDHAPDSQINGVAEYYNVARRPPLRLCGLPE